MANSEEKGEFARYEQFLHFSQCFQKTCLNLLFKFKHVYFTSIEK